MQYHSDRELGEQQRNRTEISLSVWKGIASLIQRRIDDSSFGAAFPERCPDYPQDPAICCGMDNLQFADAIQAEIPAFAEAQRVWQIRELDMPDKMAIFALLEFCWASISKPIPGGSHSYWNHHHLTFDKGVGQTEFRDEFNWIFRRNGLAYTLSEQGMMEQVVPEITGDALALPVFRTGGAEQDEPLTEAGREFLSIPSINSSSGNKRQLRAFITHGEKRDYLADAQDVCRQVGVELVLAIDTPNLSRTVAEKVAQEMASCDIYIVLLTQEEGNEASPNATGELQHAVFSYPKRVIIFRERGVELPSNISGRATGWLDGQWKFALMQELQTLLSQVTQE